MGLNVVESQYGPSMNGLHFTGVFLNGRMIVVADSLPVKTRSGKEVHHFELEEKDPLTGAPDHTIVMSKEMYDALMTDAEIEKNKVESLSQR